MPTLSANSLPRRKKRSLTFGGSGGIVAGVDCGTPIHKELCMSTTRSGLRYKETTVADQAESSVEVATQKSETAGEWQQKTGSL